MPSIDVEGKGFVLWSWVGLSGVELTDSAFIWISSVKIAIIFILCTGLITCDFLFYLIFMVMFTLILD